MTQLHGCRMPFRAPATPDPSGDIAGRETARMTTGLDRPACARQGPGTLRSLLACTVIAFAGLAFDAAESGAATDAPILQCDILAAHPADESRVAPGVQWDLMDARAAVRACEQAVSEYPDVLRFQFQLGRSLLRAQRRDEGLPYLFAAADKGYGAAFANIGGTYQFDLGNYGEAIKWYRRGAEINDASSQIHLADMYLEGWGVQRDLSEALRWLKPLAENSNVLAEYKTALIYQRGDNTIRRDPEEAQKWLLRAASHGSARAQNDLGWAYEQGDGVRQDMEKAASWYERGAEQGWALAQINLARLYENGAGVDRDFREALYWYRLASNARVKDLRETGLNGVARVRHRVSASEIAAVDARIGNWKSLSQEESIVRVAASGLGIIDPNYRPAGPLPAPATAVAAAPAATAAPTTTAAVDSSYRPPEPDKPAAAKPAEPAAPPAAPAASESAAEAPMPAFEPRIGSYIARTAVNIRKRPGTGGARIGSLAEGEEVMVLGKVIGEDWLMITLGGSEIGYVAAPYLIPAEPTQVAAREADAPAAADGNAAASTVTPPAPAPVATPAPAPAQPAPAQQAAVQPASVPTPAPAVEATDTTVGKPAVGLPPEFADIAFGKYYALIIGNNAYTGFPKLKAAVSDARAIAKLLEEEYGFEIILLTDATRTDIIIALDGLRKKLTEDDNLLLYYAGHGVLDYSAERGYWLPVDASPDTQVNWISNITITDTLKAMSAKHALLIVDSCYSGTLTRAVTTTLQSPGYLKKMASKRARLVMTSGGLEPVLDSGGGGNHSVFAKALLDTLEENTGAIDGTSLFTSIRRPVMLAAPQTPEYSDIRFAGHDGGDFIFVRK
ncbi:caspase family protein [Oceanibacterium hippocampi]|uniref:Localization factor PodJL n=1 Tax=Oceanibacterium hippocampi TaxID=745714 RepID=A0A1Y5S071_9PROT|nr:caspase family protein [Oceanibacterium hippocampi]SLN29701.1 Localization factor PodJL [Oceanibacterium hippocampi]